MRPSTTDDALHREAVDLCTDLASLLLAHRGEVRPGDAYRIAMECVRVPGHILGARFPEARTSALRVLVALDRAGAFRPFPPREVDPLLRRLHRLAQALRAPGGAG